MLLHILAQGRIGQSPEAALVARYQQRMAWPMRITEQTDGRPPKWPEPLSPCRTVLLDERGRTLDSVGFAQLLAGWRDAGVREARFILGAADGHDTSARAGADLLLAFGPMTWPHLLARAMLAEQLYRALSILAHHPYHRSE